MGNHDPMKSPDYYSLSSTKDWMSCMPQLTPLSHKSQSTPKRSPSCKNRVNSCEESITSLSQTTSSNTIEVLSIREKSEDLENRVEKQIEICGHT